MIISAAEESDFPELWKLFNEARHEGDGFPDKESDYADFLEAVDGERILVARTGSKIVGFASIWEPDTFLHHLYVSPSCQCQGVGKTLLQHCIDQFGLPMTLKCNESSTGACQFYETLGWRNTGKAEGPEGSYILYVLDRGT